MTLDTKAKIEQYFIDNWSLTEIQFEGVEYDYSDVEKWISLIYIPVRNDIIGMNGESVGRVRNNAQLKVYCYAKSVPLAYKLADDVKSFFNGKQIDDIMVGVGQDKSVTNLDNGFFEVAVIFEINNYN